MHESSSCPDSLFIQDWENAGASLAAAICRFFELSTRLEYQCTTTDPTFSSLITRIDSTLSSFQTTLNSQLTQARVALAKTQNRLARTSSILKLPEEVLNYIFLYFVYDPRKESPTSRSVDFDVQLIYKRVHVLIGVCASWRNIVISCGPLWCLVPILDPIFGRPCVLSTKLSLERAGNQPLHLVVYKPQYRRPEYLQALKPRSSQVETINMCLNWEEAHGAYNSLKQLLNNDTRSLVKLSLRHEGHGFVSLPANSPSNPFTDLRPHIHATIKSLSVLRVSNITVAWEGVLFSRNLTEFWLGNVGLSRVTTLGLFPALASAPALRHLTIVSTQATLHDLEDRDIVAGTITLPKLRTMYLESLPYNFLDLLLTVIAPGSYQLTLRPRINIYINYPSETLVGENDICNLLRKRPVHKLILSEDEHEFWELESGLHTVLESIPALKVLILRYYRINSNSLKALVQTQGHSAFPKLEVLEAHVSTFYVPFDDLKEDFAHMLEHHPIRRMVIGGKVPLEADSGLVDETPLDETNDTIRWLKTRIPQFCVAGDEDDVSALAEGWQLWDI
ncbi:unnamed protein product [Rhizoctonia solani]|uniref:F-box domain-containing protein n=1 Tax=Rhizoctonia solani TaxID=456999 RepID=A0A8H3E8R2_9AGAM|nr:unnamed protein product [Rhizoctonia solani]